jgi:hypothetical protein
MLVRNSLLNLNGLLYCLVAVVQGTEIHFEGSPNLNDVKSGLTPRLKLRCFLNESSLSPGNAVVGRDVSQTSSNIQQISSLIVMQNGVDIASITEKVPPKPLINGENFTVIGDVFASGLERGFIELTWLYPDQSVNGEYTCEASAVSDVGHALTFSKTLDLEVSLPEVVDLVNHIRHLEIDKASSDKIIVQLQTRQDSCERKIIQLEATQTSMTDRINTLNHTEVGIAVCGDSGKWTGVHDGGYHFMEQRVNFRQAYSRRPTVHIEGLPRADIHEDYNLRYHVYVVSVDERGFRMRCEKWADTHIYSLQASWISIPQ